MNCCLVMQSFLNAKCDQHDNPWECADMVVVQAEDGRIGIPVRDGGESFVVFDFCPWCGQKLKTGIGAGSARQLFDIN